MRERRLIEKGSVCDLDFADKAMQSVADARKKDKVLCPNLAQCKKRSAAEGIRCYRTAAQEMAGFILDRKSPFEKAVQEEKKDFLDDAPEGKYWVCRNGEWEAVRGKAKVVEEIVAFALVVIDRQPRERRPFTKDGMRTPELSVFDAADNAELDLDDVSREARRSFGS